MGTPEFSVPCLEALINSKENVVGVFCNQDKPVGRKQVITPCEVKLSAVKNNIPVYQPNTLKNEEALNIIKELNPELIVVVAYGKILPKSILEYPKYGCINMHASILPNLRGASPIQWSIVCGEKETGITAMQMDEGLDTGDILKQEKIAIDPNDNAGTLHDKLSALSAKLLTETINDLKDNKLNPVKQGECKVYAPIINKKMGELDFINKSSEELNNLVRGFNPWPCCSFIFNNRRIKVFETSVGPKTDNIPGTVFINNGKPFVACKNGSSLELKLICPEGSKKMTGSDAVKGRIIE